MATSAGASGDAASSPAADMDDRDLLESAAFDDDDDGGVDDDDEDDVDHAARADEMQRMMDAMGEAPAPEEERRARAEDEEIGRLLSKTAQEKQAEERNLNKPLPAKKSFRKVDKRRVRFTPPGLDLFSASKFLHAFKADDLDLEREFGYAQKRARLLRLGVDPKEVEALFKDRYAFVASLAPDACSALIADEEDFKKVCDFLFFFASSCADPLLAMLYRKALFDLLKNYAYRSWRLGLPHLFTALDNLGMDLRAATDEDNLQQVVSSRLDDIGDREEPIVPEMPGFFKERVKDKAAEANGDSNGGVDEVRLRCIKDFMEFFSDLLVSHLDCTEFRPASQSSRDWIRQLVLVYVYLTAASDRHLVSDALVCRHAMMLMHCQINSFSLSQWTGKPEANSLSQAHSELNARCDFIEVIAGIGSHHQSFAECRPWDLSELPPRDHFASYDHHHNMVRRLDFLPPSHRGTQVKRGVAYLNFQFVLDPAEHELVDTGFVGNFYNFLHCDNDNLATFRALMDEYYVMFSLVQMVDAVVGNHVDDFAKRPALTYVEKLMSTLSDYQSRRLKHTQNENAQWLMELITQVLAKWKFLRQRHSAEESVLGTF